MPSAATGYGHAHQRLRKALQPAVASGNTTCWRCRQPITAGELWDLGHDDHDRSRYRGPEHRACNRSTAGRPNREPHPGILAGQRPKGTGGHPPAGGG